MALGRGGPGRKRAPKGKRAQNWLIALLQEIQEELQLTNAEFAEAMDVSTSTLEYWYANDAAPGKRETRATVFEFLWRFYMTPDEHAGYWGDTRTHPRSLRK